MRDPRLRLPGVLVLLAGGIALGVAAGLASASTLDTTGGSLDTGSVAVTAVCNTAPLQVSAVRTSYAEAGYEIREFTLSSLNSACQNKPYALTVALNVTPYTALGAWTGLTPSGIPGSLTTSSGASVNGVPTTNQVRTYVVVRTS